MRCLSNSVHCDQCPGRGRGHPKRSSRHGLRSSVQDRLRLRDGQRKPRRHALSTGTGVDGRYYDGRGQPRYVPSPSPHTLTRESRLMILSGGNNNPRDRRPSFEASAPRRHCSIPWKFRRTLAESLYDTGFGHQRSDWSVRLSAVPSLLIQSSIDIIGNLLELYRAPPGEQMANGITQVSDLFRR